MKRLVLVTLAMVLLLAAPAMAGWHPQGKAVAWDVVTQDTDNNNLECDLLYRVYARENVSGAVTLLGETGNLTFIPMFTNSRFFYVGVSAVGVVDGVAYDEFESDITWSDMVAVPFGLMSWLKLQAPKGLRLVP